MAVLTRSMGNVGEPKIERPTLGIVE